MVLGGERVAGGFLLIRPDVQAPNRILSRPVSVYVWKSMGFGRILPCPAPALIINLCKLPTCSPFSDLNCPASVSVCIKWRMKSIRKLLKHILSIAASS